MLMGRVVGTVVATHKDEGMTGFKLMLVQNVDLEMRSLNSYTVAIDAVGAGLDEIVIVVQGSSARLTELTKNKPVDAAIICIVDQVEQGGRQVYLKRSSERVGPILVESAGGRA